MNDKIYTFKISCDEKTFRIIEIRDSKSLYMLAMIILKSFDFDFDHAFGFYNNVNDLYESDEIYELFVDLEDCSAINKISQSVALTKIKNVFIIEKQMIFLFDYGDMHLFNVECIKISTPLAQQRYPKIIEKVGPSSEQYPQ